MEDLSSRGSAIILLGIIVNATAATSSSPVRQADLVTHTSIAAKAVASPSPLGAPSPYPTPSPVSLARPPYERLAALATYARPSSDSRADGNRCPFAASVELGGMRRGARWQFLELQ